MAVCSINLQHEEAMLAARREMDDRAAATNSAHQAAMVELQASLERSGRRARQSDDV
jgi:hypothetical protein